MSKKLKRDIYSMNDMTESLPNEMTHLENMNAKLDNLLMRVVNIEKILMEQLKKNDGVIQKSEIDFSYIS